MSSNVNAIDVTYQTEINLESKSTEQLAAEVNVRYHQAEGLASMSAMMLADAGRRLIEIKGRIPHGQFESWCADNLEFSKSKAEKMMKLAERVDDESSFFSKTETFTDIGISRVWALLAAPEEVAAEVIETHDVSEMTVRELKEEIARLKEEKAAAEHKAAQKEDLTKELNEARASADEIQIKLDKAKEDLKKAKQKLKDAEAKQDDEVQEKLAKASAEIEEKAKADAYAEAEEEINKAREQVSHLTAEVERLEAQNQKLSNPTLTEFKVLADQLQDVYHKITNLIDQQDEELAQKMSQALNKLTEGWRL